MPKLSELIAQANDAPVAVAPVVPAGPQDTTATGQPAERQRIRLSDVVRASGGAAVTSNRMPDMVVTPDVPNAEDSPWYGSAADWKRAISNTGRDVVHGIASIPSMLIDPVMLGVNKTSEALGYNYRAAYTGDVIDRGLTAAGVPDIAPASGLERGISRVNRGVSGAASGIGLGQIFGAVGATPAAATVSDAAVAGSRVNPLAGVASKAVPNAYLAPAPTSITEALGGTLAASPTAQAVSAATGGIAAQAAHEGGFGPYGEIAAGLIGGALPGVAQIGAGAVRSALVGGPENRLAAQKVIDDFAQAGSAPTVGQATNRGVLQGMESTLAKTPGATTVMRDAATRQANEVAAGADKIADSLSLIKDPAGAGRTIERGISGAGGFMDRFKTESGGLYDKLDQHIPADSRMDVSATKSALDELTASIPGAPSLSRFFQNAKIGALKGALKSDADGEAGALSQPGVADQVDAIKSGTAARNQSIEEANQQAIADAARQNAGMAGTGATPVKPVLQEPVSADANIGTLLDQMADGKLPYEAVKKLRTLVGNELTDGISQDVPRSKWKALYGALSTDLKGAAEAAGPEAQQAYSRANTYYRAGQERIASIARVVDKTGGPEAVFNAATSGTKDGATTLRSIMQSLQPDEQKVLASVMVRRLGKANPGQQNAAGDEFNLNTYLTNWNKLSPDARNALFGRFGKDFQNSMDGLASVADSARVSGRIGANPSGTAQAGAQMGAWAAFLGSLAHGNVGAAGVIGGGMGGANLTARLMTNPRFVSWLARQSRSGPPQQANVAQLANMAVSFKDPDLKAVADQLAQYRANGDDGSDQQ